MAKVRVAPEIVADRLFGYSENPVTVKGVRLLQGFGNAAFEFDISGPDVPDCAEVNAVCDVQQNRAGQQLVRMRFEKV